MHPSSGASAQAVFGNNRPLASLKGMFSTL